MLPLMSSEAEDLVREARAGLRPSDADGERVLAALLPRLGGGPGAENLSEPAVTTAATKMTLVKLLGMLVGLGLAGGGLFLALRPTPTPKLGTRMVTTTAVAAPATPSPAAPAPIDDPSMEVAAVAPPAQTGKKSVLAPHPADNLAQEVAILSRASAELHAHRPAAALVALAEHQRRFPAGVLVEERTAARVQALCALGRTQEAKAELARLARMSPNSPHEARARKACRFVPTESE